MTKTRVLIVEDDASMTRYLSTYLARHNFDVQSVDSGEEAIRTFRVHDPELVLMDVALGGMSGLETLERIKEIKPEVSVIMISGQNDPELIFRTSKLGADDYIGKPFSPKELVARMKAVLRRTEPHAADEMLVLGDVVVQRDAREVGVAGQPVELRPKEFDLLAYLIQNRGVVVSRDVLLERVWGMDYAGGTRTVDVHVAQLRRKLGRPGLIRTIRGAGYKAVAP